MPSLKIHVGEDEFFKASGAPGILGPREGDESHAWLLYLPGQVPCICDDFDSASEHMMDWVKKQARRSRTRAR